MEKKQFSFALYDAFSDRVFGGSQGAVITDAKGIDSDIRQLIAREIGMPATAFVDAYGSDWIEVQFMSTVMELPMCGHGTICLLTHLLQNGYFKVPAGESFDIQLLLPKSTATVTVNKRVDQLYNIMLDIKPPEFVQAPTQTETLLRTLGLGINALSEEFPLETANGDFVHLVVPLKGLEAMQSIKPDFAAMIEFCHAHGIETVAVFCTEVIDANSTIHVRDFCPAVGVSESAAAGTTNAALTSYLLRHNLVDTDDNTIEVIAEQGIELGRPSSITSKVTMLDGDITRLQVGGVASRVLDGHVYL